MHDTIASIERFACCPVCGGPLTVGDGRARCGACDVAYPILAETILSTVAGLGEIDQFSQEKWGAFWGDEAFQEYGDTVYRETTLPLVERQLFAVVPEEGPEGRVYLEIGCGRAILGEAMARRGWFFIGVDYALPVLVAVKRRLDAHGITNYLLIHGDITRLPVHSDTVDLIYGGGVIEHFPDTQPVVDHLHRVLAPGGVSLNAVPCFNLGNLVYRSQWGSIPDVPILRPLAEFINLKLLRGKHMRFGFELQFTEKTLRRIHVRAGFEPERIAIERFDYTIALDIIKNPSLRRLLIHLIRTNRQFWQMVKVIAVKRPGNQSSPDGEIA